MYGSPTIGADGTIYLGSSDGNLYAVTDKGGSFKKKWRFSTGVLSIPYPRSAPVEPFTSHPTMASSTR